MEINERKDESVLIKRIKSGDHLAFEEIVDQYKQMVINTCIGLLHHNEDAEDVAQEVFIEIYQSIHQFREASKLSTWIYRIAINKSLNFIRKKKGSRWIRSIESFFTGEKKQVLEIPDKQSDQPEELLEKKERADKLYHAIDSLSENQRIAFTLHKYDDLPYKEIAEVMNLSLSAVESLIHRAKKNLQKKLSRYYYGK